jgi:hypothetical protein
MRCLGWVSAMGLLLLFQASIADGGCASCTGNDGGSYRNYRGPACFAPPGYSLAPGCCECPPSACDNAWDGYCEEKAKWQAFFARVGTPRAHNHGCPTMVPVETCSDNSTYQPAVESQPKPAAKASIPPAPSPPVLSPVKATRKTSDPWLR